MLRNLDELEHYSIEAIDGEIGKVTDALFSDKDWVVRYLIVDTGNWLFSRKVLISPLAIEGQYWSNPSLAVNLTQEQVKNSPDIDAHKPVSRQHELDYFNYYGLPVYWSGSGIWGASSLPYGALQTVENQQDDGDATEAEAQADEEAELHENDDPNLNSANTVLGYHIEATDGEIGHVKGLILDEETWAIRYLIVDTSNWWLGHLMVIPLHLIKNIEWVSSRVNVKLTRVEVQNAPPFNPSQLIDREYEELIYHYYGLKNYWSEASVKSNGSTLPDLALDDVKYSKKPKVTPEERHRMIEREAYLGAYARSFSGGDSVADWLTAEKKVDEQLM